MVAAIYSRKSKYTGKGESVENQIEICKDFIARYHCEYNEIIVYEDEGFSGKDLDRPNFKKLFRDAKEKKFEMLFCYRLDRVSRNISDFSALIHELSQLGIGFVSIKEQFDTSTPIGRAMMYMASVFSQLERETIAERIKDNMYELAKTGRWLGGVTPTGFDSEKIVQLEEGKIKTHNILTPKNDELYDVRLIYSKYLELRSLTAVEQFLNANGYRTKNRNRYSRYTIKSILENPVYAKGDMAMYRYFAEKNITLFADEKEFNGEKGMMAFNKTFQQKHCANVKNSVDKWIMALGEHKGIIDGKYWIEVQHTLANNRNKRYRKAKNNDALFRGILKCGQCGAYMRPKLYYVKEGAKHKYSYICELKEKSKGTECSKTNIKGEALDFILKEMLSTILNTEQSRDKKELVLPQLKHEKDILQEKYRLNNLRIEKLTGRIKDVDDDIFKIILKEIEDLKKENSSIKEDMKGSQKNISFDDKELKRTAAEIIRNYTSFIFHVNHCKLQDIMRKVIKEMKADNDTIVVEFIGSGERREVHFP